MVLIKISTRCRIVVQANFPIGHHMAGEKYADAKSLEEAEAIAAAALMGGAASAGLIAHYRPAERPSANVGLASLSSLSER